MYCCDVDDHEDTSKEKRRRVLVNASKQSGSQLILQHPRRHLLPSYIPQHVNTNIVQSMSQQTLLESHAFPLSSCPCNHKLSEGIIAAVRHIARCAASQTSADNCRVIINTYKPSRRLSLLQPTVVLWPMRRQRHSASPLSAAV